MMEFKISIDAKDADQVYCWINGNDGWAKRLELKKLPVNELVDENARLTDTLEYVRHYIDDSRELYDSHVFYLNNEIERLTAEIETWRNTHDLDVEYGSIWHDESNDLQAEICESTAELEAEQCAHHISVYQLLAKIEDEKLIGEEACEDYWIDNNRKQVREQLLS